MAAVTIIRPRFLRKWRRTVVYLPEYPAVVVYDEIDMDDPRKLPSFDRYATGDLAMINAAPALRQWFLHTPVVPTIAHNKATWQQRAGRR